MNICFYLLIMQDFRAIVNGCVKTLRDRVKEHLLMKSSFNVECENRWTSLACKELSNFVCQTTYLNYFSSLN